MFTSLIECILYTAFILSLGSYSAAFTVRWPAKILSLWKQEAHDILSLPFTESPDLKNNKRSHCPNCHHTLAWFDIIPLFSYLLLKRKCRYCKRPIPFRYPVIELLHLICCIPLLWFYQDRYELLLHTVLISTLITAAIIDSENQLIPDECCVLVLISAFLIHLTHHTLESSVLGLLIGYLCIYVLRWLYQTIRQQNGIGLGDVKLVGVLGTWLGFENLAPLLLCASLSGILYTMFFNKTGTQQVSFGPFLVFSAILVFYFNL